MKLKHSIPVAIAVIFLVTVIYGIAAGMSQTSWTNRGSFGSMFLALNTFYSGCAFAILIITLHSQQTQLALQRDQLQLTKEKLDETAQAQESSRQLLSEQVRCSRIEVELKTLTNLLSVYVKKRSDLGDTLHGNQVAAANELDAKIRELTGRVEEIYDQFTASQIDSEPA